MKKILCLGDICCDILIPYGDYLRGLNNQVSLASGGTIANTASGLARLKTKVSFLGNIGNDSIGMMLKNDLEKDHVDTSLLQIRNDISSVSVMVVIDKEKERHPFLLPNLAKNQTYVYDDDYQLINLDEYGIVFTAGFLAFEDNVDTLINFYQKCQKLKIRTAIDLNLRIEQKSKDLSKLKELLKYTDVIFGSLKSDFLFLTNSDNINQVLDYFNNPEKIIVVKDGENGSTVYHQKKIYHQEAFKVKIVDLLGAGDAYNSGFLSSLIEDNDLEKANLKGAACAALNIQKSGARNCPTKEEVADFLKC